MINGLDNNTAERSNTLAAIFATEHDARDGIKELHKAGFRKTWVGMTRPADRETGEATVEVGGNPLARFLSAGSDRRPLHKVLIERGLTDGQAEQVETDIAVGMTVLTVYGEDNPEQARQLLSEAHGHVIGGLADAPTAVQLASEDPRTGVDRNALHARADENLDEEAIPWTPDGVPAEGEDSFRYEEFYSTRDR